MYHEIETPKIFFIFHETGLILQNSTCPFRKLKRTDSEKVSYTSSNKICGGNLQNLKIN